MPDRSALPPDLSALVVEDDAVTREFLVEALAQLGWTVAAAPTVTDAIRRIRDDKPRLVICDVRLPDGDAFALAAELRPGHGDERNGTYAIATSAGIDTALRERLIDAGYDDVLPKPMPLDLLTARLPPANSGTAVATGALAERPARGFAIPPASDPTAGPPVLDDVAALEVCGDTGTVDALRRLLADELPGCLQRLQETYDTGDLRGSSELLHRLRSASGFCGAIALAHAVSEACANRSESTPGLARVLREGHALIGQLALRGAQQQLGGA